MYLLFIGCVPKQSPRVSSFKLGCVFHRAPSEAPPLMQAQRSQQPRCPPDLHNDLQPRLPAFVLRVEFGEYAVFCGLFVSSDNRLTGMLLVQKTCSVHWCVHTRTIVLSRSYSHSDAQRFQAHTDAPAGLYLNPISNTTW